MNCFITDINDGVILLLCAMKNIFLMCIYILCSEIFFEVK
jgi:hypothetical protein